MNRKHTALGIDLGSSRMILAAVMRGGVEIVINGASYRSTPSLLSFGGNRLIGDDAKSKIKRNLKNAVFFPTRYIGRKNQENFVKEKAYNFSKVSNDDNNGVSFNVMYQGERINLDSTQTVTSLFTQIKRTLDINNMSASEIVLSVPSYADNSERQALLDAAKVTGLNVVRLYNESTANVMNYGIFRKADLKKDEARLVGFVDVGVSKSSIFFAQIYKDKAEIVFELNDRHLGVRDIDRNMEEFYIKEFQKKYNEDLRENPKSVYRLREGIEKQRKILSSNNEAALHIECLFEDFDFDYNITREDFERINKNVFERFSELMKTAVEKLGKDIKKLHSVERIGGGTRIPAMESTIIKGFKLKQLNKTLDAAESIARGCAIQAAMLSPNYNVSTYKIKERNYYPIGVELYYEGDEANKKTSTLFREGHEINTTLTISIKKKQALYVTLVETTADGEKRPIANCRVLPMKPKHENVEGKLWFELGSNGQALVKKAEMIEKYTVEEKIPIKKKEEKKEDKKDDKKDKKDEKEDKKEGMEVEEVEKEGMEVEEEEFEIKKKDKVQITPLTFEIVYHDAATPEKLENYAQVENNMCKKESILIETQKAKYILESFIYETRTQVNDSSNQILTTQAEKTRIIAALASGEDWLYSDGLNCNKETYEEKYNSLSKECSVFTLRLYKLRNARDFHEEAFTAFNTIGQNNNKLVPYATDVQANELKSKFSEGSDAMEKIKDLFEKVDIGKTDAFDLEKFKKIVNDSYKGIENVVKLLYKQKEEEEKKKKEAEDKKKKEAEEKKKKEEEEKKKKEKKKDEKEGDKQEDKQEEGMKIEKPDN